MNEAVDVTSSLTTALRRFDPVRVALIEAMARRAAALDSDARPLAQDRIAQLIIGLQAGYAQAYAAATRVRDELDQHFPAAGAIASHLLEQGDFRGLRHLRERLEQGTRLRPLAALLERFERAERDAPASDDPVSFDELLRQQEQTAWLAQTSHNGRRSPDSERSGELRAMRQFREAWAKRVLDKAVAHAMEEAPEDAGPLNAHRLVIQAVSLMQDISPAYLNRFVSYVDTLHWLERAGDHLPGAPAATVDVRQAAKGKRPRGRG